MPDIVVYLILATQTDADTLLEDIRTYPNFCLLTPGVENSIDVIAAGQIVSGKPIAPRH